jgi:hypothetical protein
MMRYRIALLTVVVVALLGTGAGVAAAQGMTPRPGLPIRAAQAASATSPFTYVFYLYDKNGDTNCIVTNGVGNQLTINSGNPAGCANIKATSDGAWNGLIAYQFTDGNGNCIRANSSNVVLVENGVCNTTDDGERWVITSCYQNPPPRCTTGFGSRYRFENVHRQLWLKTTGNTSGDKVWVGTADRNEWDLY